MSGCRTVVWGVTAAKGFRAAGVHAGIKAAKPDLALLVSDVPAAVAGMFTTNRVKAAPVILCQERLKGRVATAIVVNSGSANACTGMQGKRDALRMADCAAKVLRAKPRTVFCCSTGTIGKPLPMAKIEAGIPQAAQVLSPEGGPSAALAIMTTDTVDKQFALETIIDGVPVRVGGMAKGSGMIEPRLATMLAFLTTDAAVQPAALQACLKSAVNASFNRITVDGDTSTNDTVLLMANGMAGTRTLSPRHPQWSRFVAAVKGVCLALAKKIVLDGEGATKFVSVTVSGARNDAEAETAARAVANSLLVKTSWFGMDPNWGRIIAAVGYSGASVNPDRVDIYFDGKAAVKGGRMAPRFSLADLEAILKQKAFEIEVRLHIGKGADTVYTCDCSYDYVKINASYLT